MIAGPTKPIFSRHNHCFFCPAAEIRALEVLGFPFSRAEIFLRIYHHTPMANIHLRSLTLFSSPCPLCTTFRALADL